MVSPNQPPINGRMGQTVTQPQWITDRRKREGNISMHLVHNKNTCVTYICPFSKDKCPFPVEMVIMAFIFWNDGKSRWELFFNQLPWAKLKSGQSCNQSYFFFQLHLSPKWNVQDLQTQDMDVLDNFFLNFKTLGLLQGFFKYFFLLTVTIT